MSEMVLKCENLVKQYKDKRALDNVSPVSYTHLQDGK